MYEIFLITTLFFLYEKTLYLYLDYQIGLGTLIKKEGTVRATTSLARLLQILKFNRS